MERKNNAIQRFTDKELSELRDFELLSIVQKSKLYGEYVAGAAYTQASREYRRRNPLPPMTADERRLSRQMFG